MYVCITKSTRNSYQLKVELTISFFGVGHSV